MALYPVDVRIQIDAEERDEAEHKAAMFAASIGGEVQWVYDCEETEMLPNQERP